MGIHETKRIVIKEADVDVGMIEFVNWVNSHGDAVTVYSCQGSEKGDGSSQNLERPYCVFYCSEYLSLARIVKALTGYGVVEVDWYGGSLRYTVRFTGCKSLRHFVFDRLPHETGLPAIPVVVG